MHYNWLHELDEEGGPGDTGLYRFENDDESLTITYEQWRWIDKTFAKGSVARLNLWHLSKIELLGVLEGYGRPEGPDLVDLILEDKEF